MIEFIRKVELEYKVSSVTVNNLQVWPFLRIAYSNAYLGSNNLNVPRKILGILKYLKRIKNILYGISNLFRSYDYLVFTDTFERRLVEGKYIDKISEELIKILGEENVLVIETPVTGKHYNRVKISNKNIISSDIFRFLHYFILPCFRMASIGHAEVLDEINREFRLNVDYRKMVFRFLSLVKLFGLSYKIWKPKAIFVNCYYRTIHQAAIYAANKIGIDTIELQHGIINKMHFAYNVFVELEREFFPNSIFVFGEFFKSVFTSDNFFMDKKNVYVTGNMYIDYINNKYVPSGSTLKLFLGFREKYKKIVSISSQSDIEDKLIEFLNESAKLSKEILYIFVPRNLENNYKNSFHSDNIIVLTDHSLCVYKIMKESDFHSTVYSTCALEAPALGTPNILIKIDELSWKYYSELLTDEETTKFVDNPEEYVELILTWNPIKKEEIINKHKLFYKKGHNENLLCVLKKIGVKNS